MSKPAVVMQFATQIEAQPYIEILQLVQCKQKPFLLYGGDSSLYLIIGGIGVTSAAIATTYVFTTLNAEIILNIGAAGALTPDLTPGTIITVSKVYDTTRCHFTTQNPFAYALTPLPQLTAHTCISVSIPLRTPQERAQYSTIASIVDMELAGIALAAKKFSKTCYCVKYISDTSEHTTHEDI
ncbi:MAG: hypothetical protein N3F66_14460, partial [Spirochaetes bacterium]|nr:hypothetical protein [Spirochaetota bacterium]